MEKCPHCKKEIISLPYRFELLETGIINLDTNYAAMYTQEIISKSYSCPFCRKDITEDDFPISINGE